VECLAAHTKQGRYLTNRAPTKCWQDVALEHDAGVSRRAQCNLCGISRVFDVHV
jgi:hypothetical protein